jgi:predicted transport protein
MRNKPAEMFKTMPDQFDWTTTDKAFFSKTGTFQCVDVQNNRVRVPFTHQMARGVSTQDKARPVRRMPFLGIEDYEVNVTTWKEAKKNAGRNPRLDKEATLKDYSVHEHSEILSKTKTTNLAKMQLCTP